MSVGTETVEKSPRKGLKTGKGSGRPRLPIEDRKTLVYKLYASVEWAQEFEALCQKTDKNPADIMEEAIALFALLNKHPRPMPSRN